MWNIRVLIFAIMRAHFELQISVLSFVELFFQLSVFRRCLRSKKAGAGFSANPRILEILLVVGFGFAALCFALKYQCVAKSKFGIGKGLKLCTSLNSPLS